ncbi:MAG: permease-like cell division protein FtsX [Clostridia bacterium]|nr:permease-like cell division protein FtsX [Clostridia bacterium]
MKLRSFRYLVGEGFKNIWLNRLMSLASVGVLVACMLIMGVAIVLSENVNKAMGHLADQSVVMVYFEKELTDKECKDAFEKVKDLRNVKAEGSEYITADEGLESVIIDTFGENYTKEQAAVFERLREKGNPLSNGARIQLKDLGKFDKTVEEIEQIAGVSSTNSHRDLAKRINNISIIVRNGCLWIIGLLLIIAFVIVSNTIRITMFSRKLEISIMKAVGATNRFIRFPFMVEGVLLGVIASIFTTGLLYVVYHFAGGTIQSTLEMSPIPFRELVLKLLGIFAIIGIVLGLICSAFTITKYLRKEGSEFRAI